jgi:hypothetical protein
LWQFTNTPGMMRGWWGWAAKILCFEAELGREIVEEMGRNRQVLIMILMDFNHLGVKSFTFIYIIKLEHKPWNVKQPISHMLHGAGICTPTFTPILWPSHVGKYTKCR